MHRSSSTLRLRMLLAATLSWVTIASAAPSTTASTDPHTLFAAMREATGGDRWNDVGEIIVEATVSEADLRGTQRTYRDTRHGRHVTQSDVGVDRGSEGFDGTHRWMRDEKGLVTVLDAASARRQAATDAYLARNGWFATAASDPATMKYLGQQSEGARRFDKLRVTPARGEPIEAWIDADSHLLARLSRRTEDGGTETLHYADYRTVDGLRLPFSQRSSNGDASYDSTQTIRHVEVLASAVEAHFAQPASVIRDARILGNAASAEVPFQDYAGLLLVELAIDGHAPLPFILDSGGLNLLTPDAARKLGIRGEGNQAVHGVGTQTQSLQVADVAAYRLGPVQLEQQRFLIVDLPLLLTDRGDKPAIAGLIGYELLRRFTTRIDHDRRILTFTAAGGLREAKGANVLPLSFDGRTPQVHASVNGVDGVFMMDTGDSSDLTLFAPFAKAHRITLDGKLGTSHSGGVGGMIENRRGRVAHFALGPDALPNPPATLAAPSSGIFASDQLAGNIGQGILSRYVITLDYVSRRMQLRRGADWARPFEDGPSLGLGLNRSSHRQYQVVAVADGSPAQRAGLGAEDIVVALDGVPASRLSLDDLRASMRRGARQGLAVTVLRDGKPQEIRIAADRPAAALPKVIHDNAARR